MNEIETNENINESLHEEEKNIDTGAAFSAETEPEEAEGSADSEEAEEADYESIAREDMMALKREFPELACLGDISELENPLRYAALRDLGLSPAEAYLATSKNRKRDNRSHLYSTRTVSTSQKGVMPESELAAAREIFVGVSDAQIRKLYKRVTK